MSIWQLFQGEKQFKKIQVTAIRVVEAQHKSTTRKLVDSEMEHEILESMIETAKPVFSQEDYKKLNYLLWTPFRYPPLKHGSRFGSRYEPSLWYGSLELNTALAEVAFYRLRFIRDTKAELKYCDISLTAFSVPVKTSRGIDLTKKPFQTHQEKISSKHDYTDSQKLGSDMRHAAVEAFIYFSARTEKFEKNIGIFTPKVFEHAQPNKEFQTWRCIANRNGVDFIREDISGKMNVNFSAEYFGF
ncbi:MAG: RES family NAD+ phosphorylase [Proteobacteria bacterium]|nr:RES family NAD+ phosphorylase [Pseudomonadota bacterium]